MTGSQVPRRPRRGRAQHRRLQGTREGHWGGSRKRGGSGGGKWSREMARWGAIWFSYQKSAFRIRNCGNGQLPGCPEATRMTNTASDAAGEPRRTMGKQSDALRSPQERDEPRKRPLSAHYVFRIRNCGFAAAPGGAITALWLDIRNLTITCLCIQFMFFNTS